MYRSIWDCCYRSVCSICFYTESGIKMNTLTGFYTDKYIITDEYIYKIKSCYEVVFQFVERDGYTPSHAFKMSFDELNQRLNRIAEYECEGFALIHTDNLILSQVPSLIPELSGESSIGMSIAILGFHGDQDNMSLKAGTISSFIKMENGKQYIQFDAAIKQGNSGSPVINIESGKVIGVVGYRLSSFARSYEAFKNIIDENLRLLKKSEGKMNIMDIDPIQVLIANQNQLKQISKEFYKTSMMSYGFAHEVFSLKNYINVPEKAEVKVRSAKA